MLNAASYCHHIPVKPSLASLQDDRFTYSYDLAPASWWCCLCRRLMELHGGSCQDAGSFDGEISQGLAENGLPTDDPETIIYTTIKDGGDGMGDISIYKTVADSYLPDNVFRASFVILKCEAEKEGSRVTVFEEEKPNVINVCRPLLEAEGDKNRHQHQPSCYGTLNMRETCTMQAGCMKVYDCNGLTRLHKLQIYNSMIDEKLDRSDDGLQGSGSKFL
nr:V(D)J recombination-activating protein 1-like [Lytechinus pictus]